MEPVNWFEHSIPSAEGIQIAAFTLNPAPTAQSLGPKAAIFVHGITAHSHAFDAYVRGLTPEEQAGVISVDLRGRGNSSKPVADPALAEKGEGPYGMDRHADDIIAVMDYFKLEKVPIIGHSMGGFVAMQLSVKYPERITAVVLLDSGFPRQPTARELSEDTKKGLAKAFGRLNVPFADLDAYLAYWGKKKEDMKTDVLSYYTYELERRETATPQQVGASEEGEQQKSVSYFVKCSPLAALSDARWMGFLGMTVTQFSTIRHPVFLARAPNGFTPTAPPLILDEDVAAIRDNMPGFKQDLFVEGADHYTILHEPFVSLVRSGVSTFLNSLA